ncbi:hypothetical protein PGB90_001476 [Kerria lacca]
MKNNFFDTIVKQIIFIMSDELVSETNIVLDKTFHLSDVEEDVRNSPKTSPKLYQILLMNDTASDADLFQVCQLFNVPILIADSFLSDQLSEDILSLYIVNSFEGVKKNGRNYAILGRTALLELAEEQKQKSYSSKGADVFKTLERPLYCHALSGQVICFDGYRKNEDEDIEKLKSLILLVHHMGGSVRQVANRRTTFVIAKLCEGNEYRYAATFGVSVVSESWVFDAWQNRNIVGFKATDLNFVSKYKLKPFYRSRVCFLGFPEEEKHHMIEILKENGGESVDENDSTCTHLVVDESKISSVPQFKSNKIFVVNVQWFWTSVQHEYRQRELDFKIDGICANGSITPLNLNNTPTRATSSNQNRKRKRLKDKFSSLSNDLSPGQSAQKRRSSTSDVTRLDVTRISEDSFLDFTASPDIVDDAVSQTQDKSKNTTRYYKFVELCQTETNYVRILKIIMTLFKEALEKLVDDKNGQLLNATELKIIFGHLPPIYSTHCGMLEELKQMAARWNEDCSIGSLILKYAYPPFINFFENTRDMLIKCDKIKPRFHAFLKVCQSKPECGRQSLQDLLIRPVQRLPSINLLLNDILRYTSKACIDYKALEAAIVSIQDVMAHINEDKRKTEGQVALFDIFNDIENCPAYLVSSQRCFISRCEVTELSDNLSGRGNSLVLFLFSDVIEVCKKRTKAFNNLKSPKENGGSLRHGNTKLYKHVKLLPLSALLKVVDVKETEDCHNIFALMIKCCHELKESKNMIYSFTVTDETIEKTKYLHILCNQIAQVVCHTDTESYLTYLEGEQLDIVSSEVTTGTLGKAFNKLAAKTRIKVGRALSFNKTPNKLKRAVSNMISPFASQSALIASSHLANLQLAALPAIPIHLFIDKKKNPEINPLPIFAVESNRNIKSSTFNMAALIQL